MLEYDIEKREADQGRSQKGKDYMFRVNCLAKSYIECSCYTLLQQFEQCSSDAHSYKIGKRQNAVIVKRGNPG